MEEKKKSERRRGRGEEKMEERAGERERGKEERRRRGGGGAPKDVIRTESGELSQMLRCIVGHSTGMDWSRPWHEVLHDAKMRVPTFLEQTAVKQWSRTFRNVWNIFGNFIVEQIVRCHL